jgi:hypothetical protein
MIAVFERAKTVDALDRAATAIDSDLDSASKNTVLITGGKSMNMTLYLYL